MDTALFGRRTFEMFEAVWPRVLADPRSPPEMLVFARSLEEMRKIVFSTTRTSAAWRNTEFRHELARDEVEALKRSEGGDIIVFGSGSVASRLTGLGLIDEYTYIVNPVLLGSGQRLLREKAPTDLEVLEATPFASGNVVLRYARKGPMAR